MRIVQAFIFYLPTSKSLIMPLSILSLSRKIIIIFPLIEIVCPEFYLCLSLVDIFS